MVYTERWCHSWRLPFADGSSRTQTSSLQSPDQERSQAAWISSTNRNHWEERDTCLCKLWTEVAQLALHFSSTFLVVQWAPAGHCVWSLQWMWVCECEAREGCSLVTLSLSLPLSFTPPLSEFTSLLTEFDFFLCLTRCLRIRLNCHQVARLRVDLGLFCLSEVEKGSRRFGISPSDKDMWSQDSAVLRGSFV